MDRSVHFGLVPLLAVRLPRSLATLLGEELAEVPDVADAPPGPAGDVLQALADDFTSVILPAVDGPEAQRRAHARAVGTCRTSRPSTAWAPPSPTPSSTISPVCSDGRPPTSRRGRPTWPPSVRAAGRAVAGCARLLLAVRAPPGRIVAAGRTQGDETADRDPDDDRTDRRSIRMTSLTEHDDLLHPAADAGPWWSETCWFSFDQLGPDLSATIYPLFRPNLGVCSLGVYLWDGSAHEPWKVRYGRAFWQLPMPATDLDALELVGLRYERLEPLRRFRVRYEDGDAVALDLESLVCREPHQAHLAEGVGHYDQPCHVVGEVSCGGRRSPSTPSACATARGHLVRRTASGPARPTPMATARPTSSSCCSPACAATRAAS